MWHAADMTWTLADIEGIIRSSWGADTCPPDARNPVWDPTNPPRGQCGVTALVVQDLLGGDLVRAEVHVAAERVDFHWWNRLPGGVEVDLTREQFGPEEILTAVVALARPTTPMKRGREEYETLRRRVFEALGRDGSTGSTADGRGR
jgi:hypothetical protein